MINKKSCKKIEILDLKEFYQPGRIIDLHFGVSYKSPLDKKEKRD